jgi:hypothetical protein
LRMNIVSFAESVALARTLRGHRRRGDRS